MPMLQTSNCISTKSVIITIGGLYLVFLLGKFINDKKKKQVEKSRKRVPGGTGVGGGGPGPASTVNGQPPEM
ncbi:unnamed protein product [Lathyrus oleraceus]